LYSNQCSRHNILLTMQRLVSATVATFGAAASLNCTLSPGLRVDGNDVGSVTVNSVEECCANCETTGGCNFFTFVQSKSLCWLKSAGTGTHHNDDNCVSGRSASVGKCSTDESCNYAGHCVQGTCRCDPPFHGDACETFSLYNYKPGEGGLLMPDGNTTWGGTVVEADDGTHHMYVAMMSNNLTLSSWLSRSVVAHAVSVSGPAGPFTFSDVALGPRGGDWWDAVTCHNPDAKRMPDGTYVIYYMGSTDHLNGSASLEFNQRVGIAWSQSPYGPWTRSNMPVIPPGPKGAWDDGFTTNPAPFVYPNGSVLVIYKARSMEQPDQMLEGVAIADNFLGPYVKMTPDAPLDLDSNCEDAGIYRTNDGVFRMLTHCGCSGQYMWSLDGFTWKRTTPSVPFCHNVSYTDGSFGDLKTRQRPKWVVGKDGVATHLLTGVNRPGDGGMGHTWTMAASFSKPSFGDDYSVV